MTILSPSVERLLSASISRVRRIYLLRGAAMTLASLLAGALAVMAIDAKFAIFSVSARWWMSAALYALVVATAALSILRPLLRRIDARRMAEILDGRHPEHEECLMTLVELNENRSAGCSERLLQVLEKKASDAASRLSAEKEFTARTIVRRLWVLLSVAGLLAVSFAVFPGVAGRLFVRAVAPWVDVGNLYADCITVSPGDIDALAGSLVRIEAAVAGGDVPAIRISRRTGKGWGPEFSEPMKDGVYEFIADIGDAEWRYRVSAGHAVTRHYRVRVFETPRCESFVARVEYPAYTRFAPAVYSNEEATTVQAIEGSHVRFEAKPAGKDVFAKIFVGGVETNEHTAVSNIVTSWSLAVSNAAGFSAPERGGLIRSLPDAPPIVVVESPDSGVLSLAPHAKFPLEITASDDVGIFAPELIYAKAGGETVKWRDISEYAKTGPSLWRGMDSIDLSTLDLEGIASVEFAVVVRDFRPERFGGPHCVTSAPVVVRLENRALSFEMQELAKVVEESKRLLAEAENRVNDAQNAAWNDPGRAIHETGEAKKRLEELEALLDADRRFEPIAGEIRRTLEKLFEPALERLRESRYAAQEKRVQSLRETLPELKEALERLRRLEKPFAERVQELENAERVEDLARKQLSLENAARRLAAENPQDPDRLEAWKRMQEEVARETGELIDRLSDRQVDEAWRQMKKAVDLANRLKESLALENDASRSEVAKKQAMDEMARRDMERKREMLAQALEHERAAEWHLGEAAKSQKANPDHAEDQKRQAMQRLRNAADLLEQANAGRDSVKALEAAAEELDKILGSEKPAEKALKATTRSKHELEKETDAFDKTARENASAERRRDAELRKEAAALDAEEELKRATERLASGENGDEFRELDRMMGVALEADRKALEENLDNAANLPQDLAARLDRMKSESGPDSKAAAGDIEKAAKKIAEKLAQGLKAAAERDQGFKSALEERTRREEEAARSWREELERAEYADGQDAMREKSADDGLKRESADFAGQASQSLEEGRLDDARTQAAAAADKLSAAKDASEDLVKAEDEAVAAIDELKRFAEDAAETAKLDEAARQAEAAAAEAARAAEEKRREADRLAAAAADAQNAAETKDSQAQATAAQERADAAAREAAKAEARSLDKALAAAEARENAEMSADDPKSIEAAGEYRKAIERAIKAATKEEASREAAREATAAAQKKAESAAARAQAADEALEAARSSGDKNREDTASRQAEAAHEAAAEAKAAALEAQKGTRTKNSAEAPPDKPSGAVRSGDKAADDAKKAEAIRKELAAAQRDIAEAIRNGADGQTPAADLFDAAKAAKGKASRLAEGRRRAREAATEFAAARALAKVAEEQARAAAAFAADNDALAAEALQAAQEASLRALENLGKRLADERLARDAARALKDAIEAEGRARANRQEAINQANAAASSRDGNQKMLARQSNEAAEGLEELVANDMAEAKRATAAEEDDGEDGGDTPPAATPEAAAGRARESLDRSLKRRAKSLGTASLRFGGNGRPAGSIDRRIDDLARELKLADDPENARKLLEESGWFRIRGAAKDGVGEHELKDIPAEYRDLVRLYFLKLAE